MQVHGSSVNISGSRDGYRKDIRYDNSLKMPRMLFQNYTRSLLLTYDRYRPLVPRF